MDPRISYVSPAGFMLHRTLLKAGLPLILLLSLVLRLYGIGWGLPDAGHPQSTFHPDEVLTLDLAEYLFMGEPYEKSFMYGGTLFFSFLHGVVMLGRFLLRLFPEYGLLELALITGRLLMALFSLASITLMYVIGSRLFGKAGGLLTAACTAVMPAMLIWSQRLRPDELAAFLVVLMIWIALQVYHYQGRRQLWYLVAAGLLSGVLLSYRFPLLVFGLMPLMAVLIQRGFHLTLDVCWRLLFPLPFLIYCVGLPLGYLLTSPHSLMYPDILYQGLSVQFGFQSQPFADAMEQGPKFIQVWWSMLHQGLGYPLYFCSLAGLVLALKKQQAWAVILSVALLPYLLFLVATSWVVVRYTLPLLPLLAIFSAYGLLELHTRVGKMAWWLGGFVLTLTLMADMAFIRLEAGKNVRQEMREWVDANIPPAACLILLRSYVEDTFYNPALGEERCSILLGVPGGGTIQNDFQPFVDHFRKTLAEQSWQYLLMHEYHYGNMDRLQTRHPTPAFAALYLVLQELPLQLVHVEEKPPVFAGMDFSAWFSAHDLRYVNPGYRVYERVAPSPP